MTTKLKAFFALAAIAIALISQAKAQSAIGPEETNRSNGTEKAGYRMKLCPLGAVPSFPVGLSEAYQVSVFGNRAFVLTQGAIAIIDISDPANPVQTGGFSPGIQDFVAFASDGKNIYGVTAPNHFTDPELEIWDVTDGAHPAKRSALSLGSRFFLGTIQVAGRLVFVKPLYDGNTIKIIDVSDPSRPRAMAEYSASGDTISGLAVSGDKLLVTSGGSLEVIGISTPASPKLLASLNLATKSWGIEVAGNTAFVGCYEADGFEGRSFLAVVDVSDPKRPVQTAKVGESTVPSGLTSVVAIAAGDFQSLGLMADGPGLVVKASGNNLFLSWPLWAQDFILQSTTHLADEGSWTPVLTVPMVQASRKQVSDPISNPAKFYRLKK